MFVHRYSVNSKYTINPSFFVTQCGYETCTPNHSYGPVTRDHNIIHFVFSGKGTFEINDKEYELTENQGFFIPTGTPAKYTSDSNEPWKYAWIGFDGDNTNRYLSLKGLSTENVIFNFSESKKIFTAIKDLVKIYGKEGNGFYSIAKLFEIFSYINPEIDNSIFDLGVLNELILDIENEHENITVEMLSKNHHLSRSQIYRIFKTKLAISPQQYIKNYRINHAADLLRRTELTISEIMELSGFSNPSNFSRQFKAVYTRSPRDFREYVKLHSTDVPPAKINNKSL